jgi:peptidoglycan/LPS O-acetylase OafA/YrhL
LLQAPQKSRDIRYRPDIDGLRAIAVLLVVAYHIGLPAFTGGFVGVDIFFVISGFLISGILLREQATGTFSIVRFYERRVRRIFPALIGVLVFVFVVGYFALLPYEMKELGQSILAALFSAANIFFWKSSSYFQAPALSKPLLHTWSLAVEEQFYVVFPLLLLLLHRLPRRYLKLAILLMAIASFAASATGVYTHPGATFYLPHTRAWELLLGTILALEMVPAPRSSLARNLTSLTGLALILVAAFVFTGTTPFPGAAALLPCLGAALIIAAGVTGSSVIGKVLATPPFVFVGLISYSLYLWHWPLLLVNKFEYFRQIHLSKTWLFAVMILVATLSWRFVEQPFRSGALKLPRKQLFAAAALAVAIVGGFSAWAVKSNGIPARFSPDVLALAQYTQGGWTDSQWHSGCFAFVPVTSIQPYCLVPTPGRPNLLLFGDSHAAHLGYGLTTVFPESHLLEATASNCKPLLASRNSPNAFCREIISAVFDRLLPDHPPGGVILSAFWDAADAKPLAETVAYLHAAHLRVYVVGPSVEYDQPLPNLLINAIFRRDPALPAHHFALTASQYQALDELLANAALSNGAYRYISLRQIMCPAGQCIEYAAPGIPMQFDATHFTNAGSLLIAQRLRATGQMP